MDRKRGRKGRNGRVVASWSKNDVCALVHMLREFGSDFTLISTKIDKSRDQIKRKFKALEKKYPKLAEAIFQAN
jgi:GTP-binding protein EngB required for normal cell division